MNLAQRVTKAPWNIKMQILRLLEDKTQEQIAKIIEVNQRTVCLWERGEFEPTDYRKDRICAAYDVDRKELFPVEVSK